MSDTNQCAPDLPGIAKTSNEGRREIATGSTQPADTADLQAAIAQLRVWAQAGKIIRYDSGTLVSTINFLARLFPAVNDSFIVRGAAEFGAAGMCGDICPSYAEYVRVSRKDGHVAVILRRFDGSSSIVFDDGGDLEKLLKSKPATPLTN